MYGMQLFARLETHLTIGFSQKNRLKRIDIAVIILYIVEQSEKSIISIYNEF